MTALKELVEDLAARFPEDADDLRGALAVLQKQRISSCDRLGKLSDSQWQRLDLPIGIEALLKDEAARFSALAPPAAGVPAAPEPSGAAAVEDQAPAAAGPSRPPVSAQAQAHASADEHGELPLEPFDLPPEGLHRRGGGERQRIEPTPSHRNSDGGGGGGWSPSSRQPRKNGFMAPIELAPPPDLDELWQQLLEDTLPPDKRRVLQESWDATHKLHDKYMMYLEYTSYLRKPEMSDEEMADRRKQLNPLLDEFGLGAEEESNCLAALVWILSLGTLFFIAAVVYYMRDRPEPAHDVQSL